MSGIIPDVFFCVCFCYSSCFRDSQILLPEWGFPYSSGGKESACNAGDPSSIPGSGRPTGEGIGTPVFLGFPGGSAGKESACNTGDLGLIPGLGRSPGEGKATHSSMLAWRIHRLYSPWGPKESDTTGCLNHRFFPLYCWVMFCSISR